MLKYWSSKRMVKFLSEKPAHAWSEEQPASLSFCVIITLRSQPVRVFVQSELITHIL